MPGLLRSLYEKLLADPLGFSVPPAQPPRVSASVVPWRVGGGGEIEVYWVRRSAELAFMGGWHAFPGGGLSKSDAALPVRGLPAGMSEGGTVALPPEALRLGDTDPDLVPGLLACALRELFEEVGLLVAFGLPAEFDLASAHRAQLADGKQLGVQLDETDAQLDASRLVFAGRWLTPPFAPMRFDNRFFLLEWPADLAEQPEVIPGELATGEWISAAAAYDRFRRAEVLAAPPILHILRVLAEDGPERGLPRLLDPAEADWGPMRKIEMRDGIAMLPLRTRTLPPAATTNAYLLGRGDAVLVDPGSDLPEEIDRLEAALAAAREKDGRRVVEIWLTHHHPDHVAGAAELQRRLRLPIAAHPLTAERLGNRLTIARELADDQRIELAGLSPGKALGEASGEAMTFRVLHTPGHARGHLCFFEEAQGSLICGDLVAGIGTIVIDPPEGDMTAYLASLERMIALAPRTLFPAHGPAIEDSVGKLSEYVAHRLRREEKVLAAWGHGLRSAAEMVPSVYDDAPDAARLLAERQIEAHLARLRSLGRIQ
ncbi:MAG TPA: MBL fold metallo-hydrolase [Thermoanaerobaculia bacterium]|jgi:glyoxylase-like metal-dependent hydrolase (beta-lactamase superfamily II)/8-oxo-dGTP pyrophosphatase MutT (NUDIX family)|nr:MBL fold metallo-hydrolase [Thermoanaerobaculia bacterium]